MRKASLLLAWFVAAAVGAQSITSATDAFNAGKEFAQSGKQQAVGTVNSSSGTQNLPNYTQSAQQSQLYGNGKGQVGNAGVNKQLECQSAVAGNAFAQQECDAVNFLSENSSTRKKYKIGKDDPLLSNSASIIDNAKLEPSAAGSFTNCIDKVVTVAPAVFSKEFCEQMLTPDDHICQATASATVNQYGIFSCQKTRLTTSNQQCASVKYSDYRIDQYRSETKVPLTCGGDPTIQGWYQNYAGRCADVDGLNFWVNAKNTPQLVNTYSAPIVAMTCGGNPTIQGWYQNYAGRCADVDGLNWWTSQLPGFGYDYSKMFPSWYTALQGGYPGGVTKDQYFCGSSGTLSGTQCVSQTYKYPTYSELFPNWYAILQNGYPGGVTKDQWLCNPGGNYIYLTTQCQYQQVTMIPTYECASLASQSGSGSTLTYPVLVPSTCGGDPTIQSWYSQYDSRCADISGMNYWTQQLQSNFSGNYSQMFNAWYTAFLLDGGRGSFWPSLCNQGDEYMLNTTNCRKRIYATSDSCQKQSSVCVDSTPVKYFGGVAVSVGQVGGCWQYQDSYKCVSSTNDSTCNPIQAVSSCHLINTSCTNTAFDGDCMQEKLTYKCGDPSATIPGATLDQVVNGINSVTTDSSQCVPYAQNAECTQATDVCVEPKTTKIINGVPVYQDCWRWERKYTCFSGQPSEDCQNLVIKGCTYKQGQCLETTPTGRCAFQQIEYSCQVKPALTQTIKDCGAQQFCLPNPNGGQSCFDSGNTPDQDFAKAAAMMETTREAGVYGVDPNKVEIFKGYQNECSIKTLGGASLRSCCDTSGGGGAMKNSVLMQAALKAGTTVVKKGSSYMYDALFAKDSSDLVSKGIGAVNSGMDIGQAALEGSISPDFSFYGFDIAFDFTNGFELVSFDPYSFALQIAIQLITEWLACDQDEGILSMKRGENLCVYSGTRCSKRFLGICTERKQKHCCFNSILAKIINVQGKAQLGLNFDGCGGFTADQLMQIDFSKIDFTEFIQSIQAKTPDLTKMKNDADQRVKDAVKNYYGQ